MGVEGALDVVQAEALRLAVGQVGMAEGDEAVHQRRLFPSHYPVRNELPVGV